MQGYIYLIENKINNKKYIGQTHFTIQQRFSQHCLKSKTDDTPLYQAMRKYGIKNFIIKELEQCDLEKLNEREKYWIEYYDTYNIGYNATLGRRRKSVV